MVKDINLGKELVVTMPDKSGILANIAKILAEAGINIEGVAGYVAGKDATIMIVADDTLRAKEALGKSGYKTIRETEVLLVELENKPGALKGVTAKLLAENIEMRSVYGTACVAGCPAKLIITTTNNEKAIVALKAK